MQQPILLADQQAGHTIASTGIDNHKRFLFLINQHFDSPLNPTPNQKSLNGYKLLNLEVLSFTAIKGSIDCYS